MESNGRRKKGLDRVARDVGDAFGKAKKALEGVKKKGEATVARRQGAGKKATPVAKGKRSAAKKSAAKKPAKKAKTSTNQGARKATTKTATAKKRAGQAKKRAS
jgi:hypothetical protein